MVSLLVKERTGKEPKTIKELIEFSGVEPYCENADDHFMVYDVDFKLNKVNKEHL